LVLKPFYSSTIPTSIKRIIMNSKLHIVQYCHHYQILGKNLDLKRNENQKKFGVAGWGSFQTRNQTQKMDKRRRKTPPSNRKFVVSRDY
jgi:hypothetical protein